MAKLWVRPVHGVLILAEGGGGGAGPPWPYARSAPEYTHLLHNCSMDESSHHEPSTGAAAANFSWGGEARQRVCEESTCNGLYVRALKDLRNVHEKSRA